MTCLSLELLMFPAIRLPGLVCLPTLGGPVVGHIKPMITGFDKVDLSPEEKTCLERDEPGSIR